MSFQFNPPSGDTLERAPDRVSAFVTAVARHPRLFLGLAQHGYTQEEHEAAVILLTDLTTLPPEVTQPLPQTARDAITELDAWDEPNFAMAFNALNRQHSAQARFIFHDLTPSTGFDAVLAIQTFLDRLDALESSPDRAETREHDAAALDLLADRGITPDERARLRTRIEAAMTLPTVAVEDGTREAKRLEQRRQILIALHLWWKDWSTVAHNNLRRQYLVWLGLVSHTKTTPAGDEPPKSTL